MLMTHQSIKGYTFILTMIIALLFQLTFATNFLMFGQKQDDESKIYHPLNLVVFDSNTFAINTSLTIPTNASILDCNFDKYDNIYYSSINDDEFLNFFQIKQQKVSIVKKLSATIIINNNNNDVFIMTVAPGHYIISQINWPNLINVFSFESYVSIHDPSLYIQSKNIYVFSASLYTNEYYDAIIIMSYTDNFKIVNIFPIKYQVGSISYYNNTIYLFIYGQRSIELCSINLNDNNGTINYLAKYNTILRYIYASAIVDDNLYLIARTQNYDQFYWIDTNLSNLTQTMKIFPTDLGIRCIIPI